MTGNLSAHVTSVLSKVAAAMAAKADSEVIRSEPTINLAEVLCHEVRKACQAEVMTDVA